MKIITAVAVAAALVTAPAAAHHRDGDRWERRQDHHHGRWVYKTDKRLAQHRRWHGWWHDRDGRTRERHPVPPKLRVESTAYCLTGRMANGQYAHEGAVAMNGVPLGAKFRVKTGPLRGERVVVKDRIGHGSEMDVAMPGDCRQARNYGRRVVNIQRVT